ncbi:hypothetical protein CLV30_109182 [Haloactinopolyspora alba]|uniref:Uncharacterized protein n=1 Tax=Haloactinopolyspora alba TaxID=648780 RepID=A0A2P8E090_9ACTN|nr:hypothetical protein [Haloactinopolyspora alba]PSL02874.1 hypothetical protein CLV30_109182 [Haloactinopolyspora alba]
MGTEESTEAAAGRKYEIGDKVVVWIQGYCGAATIVRQAADTDFDMYVVDPVWSPEPTLNVPEADINSATTPSIEMLDDIAAEPPRRDQRTLADVSAIQRDILGQLDNLIRIIEDRPPRGARSPSTPDAPPAFELSERDQHTVQLAGEVRRDIDRAEFWVGMLAGIAFCVVAVAIAVLIGGAL